MKVIKLVSIFIICLFIHGCGDNFSQIIQIDPPEFESQLSVTGFVNAGEQFMLLGIGRNLSVLSDSNSDDFELNDAFVSITKLSNGIEVNSTEDTLFSVEDGVYFLGFPDSTFIESGEDYTFLIEHPEFENSETTLACPVEGAVLSNIRYDFEGGLTNDFEESSSISFDISDVADGPGFYQLSGRVMREGFLSSTFNMESTDPIAQKAFPRDDIFISDETFEGETRTMTIRFRRFFFNPEEDQYIELTLSSISESTFNFSRSLQRFDATNGVPFASPVQVTSNVNNGQGNIGLATQTRYIVE